MARACCGQPASAAQAEPRPDLTARCSVTYNGQKTRTGRLVQLARTPARHAGGQRFESSIAQLLLSKALTIRRHELGVPAEGRPSGLS